MADTARGLGHDYLVLTDHSPRLTVANGLSAERLERAARRRRRAQREIRERRREPFRILTGIEVDILEDGTLDQTPVVARPARPRRRQRALQAADAGRGDDAADGGRDLRTRTPTSSGHCTGRLVTGGRGTRPESSFDAEIVFAACERFGVAVEINSRPERLDPPKRLLRLAVDAGCLTSIDTDAHAPGQLDWQRNGCERAADAKCPSRQS